MNGTSARRVAHRVSTSSTKGCDRTSYLTRAPPSSLPPFLLPFPPPSSDPSPPPPHLLSSALLLASFFPPSARSFESLFIFISFGLVCRLAARPRDYRVPATHLGNSGGPLSSYYQREGRRAAASSAGVRRTLPPLLSSLSFSFFFLNPFLRYLFRRYFSIFVAYTHLAPWLLLSSFSATFSPFLPSFLPSFLPLLLSTNYLCLISDTVGAKKVALLAP